MVAGGRWQCTALGCNRRGCSDPQSTFWGQCPLWPSPPLARWPHPSRGPCSTQHMNGTVNGSCASVGLDQVLGQGLLKAEVCIEPIAGPQPWAGCTSQGPAASLGPGRLSGVFGGGVLLWASWGHSLTSGCFPPETTFVPHALPVLLRSISLFFFFLIEITRKFPLWCGGLGKFAPAPVLTWTLPLLSPGSSSSHISGTNRSHGSHGAHPSWRALFSRQCGCWSPLLTSSTPFCWLGSAHGDWSWL